MTSVKTRNVKAVEAKDAISAAELAAYIHSLSELHRDPRTGNPNLSSALRDLARRLADETNGRAKASTNTTQKPIQKPAVHPRFDYHGRFSDIQHDEIIKITGAENTPKSILISLARQRFAIPHSRLMRLSKQEIVELVQASLRHEESLDIIAREAKSGGSERTS